MKFLNYVALLLVILCLAGGVANAQVGDEDEYGYEDPGYDDDNYTWNDDNYNWSNDGSGYGGAYDDIYDIVDDILTNGLANFDDGYTHIEFDEDGGISSYNEYSWEEIDNDPALVPDYVWDALNEIQDYVDQANNYYQAALDEYNNVGTEVQDIYTYMNSHYSQYGYEFRIIGDLVLVFDQENPTEDGSPNYVIHRTDKLPFPTITPPGSTYESEPFVDVPIPEPDYPPFPNGPFDPMDPSWQQWYTDYQSGAGGGSNNNNNPPPACATDVRFLEKSTQVYGFDNTVLPHWKSIESGMSDVLSVQVQAPDRYPTVYFKAVTPANFTAWGPKKAPSSAFPLSLTSATLDAGETKRETEIQANCNSTDGTNISSLNVVAYQKIVKTVYVRVVHSKANPAIGYPGYTSHGLTKQEIKDFLNQCSYNQGVIEWDIQMQPDMTVDFDLNRDGKLDDSQEKNYTDEQIAIRTACAMPGQNIYFVDNPWFTGGRGWSMTPGLHSFVYVGNITEPLTSIVHELGHSAFGFKHDWNGDSENFMSFPYQPGRTRFRKDQWDRMHP